MYHYSPITLLFFLIIGPIMIAAAINLYAYHKSGWRRLHKLTSAAMDLCNNKEVNPNGLVLDGWGKHPETKKKAVLSYEDTDAYRGLVLLGDGIRVEQDNPDFRKWYPTPAPVTESIAGLLLERGWRV